jgi:hypothetical protein
VNRVTHNQACSFNYHCLANIGLVCDGIVNGGSCQCEDIYQNYWSIENQKCMPCPTGFMTNYFYGAFGIYYPYVCYRTIPDEREFFDARSTCMSLHPGASLMRVRNTQENANAVRFRNLYAIRFWVRKIS